jgi:hypothetical protein
MCLLIGEAYASNIRLNVVDYKRYFVGAFYEKYLNDYNLGGYCLGVHNNIGQGQQSFPGIVSGCLFDIPDICPLGISPETQGFLIRGSAKSHKQGTGRERPA